MRGATDFRGRRAARTRRRILDAGLRVFSRSGYDGASMNDIALELEATKGLLYHYFRSKQDLLKAILQEHPLRMGIETLERGVPAGDLREALSSVALLSLRELREHGAFVRFLVLQVQYSQAQHELVFRELIDRWTGVFESLIRAHLDDSSSISPRSLATQLVDVVLSSFIRSELGGRPSGRDLESYVLDAVETVVIRVESESEVRSQRP